MLKKQYGILINKVRLELFLFQSFVYEAHFWKIELTNTSKKFWFKSLYFLQFLDYPNTLVRFFLSCLIIFGWK